MPDQTSAEDMNFMASRPDVAPPIDASMLAFMELGFWPHHTGGNCWCYRMPIGGSMVVLLTDTLGDFPAITDAQLSLALYFDEDDVTTGETCCETTCSAEDLGWRPEPLPNRKYRCPKCRSDDLRVQVSAVAALIQEDDGNIQTDIASDHVWCDNSWMTCNDCEHHAPAHRFLTGKG